MIDPELGDVLLRIARAAIAARLDLPRPAEPRHPALVEAAPTFVTLRQSSALRGCIGTLEPIRPLGVDVRENAVAAAFRDPRFPPLAVAEFETTSIEVSLLSAAERVDFDDEGEVLAHLRPGVDGVILEYAGRRATFLPQVWEAIPDPREFVAALKRKAGWPGEFWSPRMNVLRYRVTKWAEADFALNEAQR